MEEGYKICPYCGGEINAKAIKCKHCKEWLTDEMREVHKANTVPQQTAKEESLPPKEEPVQSLSSEELDERLVVILKDKYKIKDKDDRLRNAALLYQKHRGGSYTYAKKYVEKLEDRKSDEKIDKWFDNYGGCLFWVIAAIVLFFTNPKSTEKHYNNIKEHFDSHVQEMQVEVKKSLMNNGAEAYYVEKVFNDVVAAKKKMLRKNTEVSSLGLLSLGRSGNYRTIGVLGMVFNVSWLFAGDSVTELEVANEVVDKVSSDVRKLNTLKQLLY